MNKDCSGCIYYDGMLKLKQEIPIIWGSTEPYPCLVCKRFEREELPDKFSQFTVGEAFQIILNALS